MAIDILSIPAMSDELERVFSGACRIVLQDKGEMEAKTLEMVECLKHWKRSGILNESQNLSLAKCYIASTFYCIVYYFDYIHYIVDWLVLAALGISIIDTNR